MAFKVLLVLFCGLLATAMSEECSPDAKKLTSLISNITSHVNQALSADQQSHHSFHESATASRNSLQEKVDRTQAQLDSHRHALSRASVQLSETHATIANVKLEMAVVQAANDNTLLECERSEQAYKRLQKIHNNALDFITMIQSYFRQLPTDDSSSQETAMSLLQALPALTASTQSQSQHTSEKLLDLQTLLQQSAESSEGPDVETVQQVLDLLDQLLKEVTGQAAEAEKRNELVTAECSSQMEALRLKLGRLEDRRKELDEKVQLLSAQIEFETNTVSVFASDVAILTHSLKSKHQIIENMNQAHQMRSQIRSSQLSHLTSLLSSPACCMCPQPEAHK